MKFYSLGVLALTLSVGVAATTTPAVAQRVAKNVYQARGQATAPTPASPRPMRAGELPRGTMQGRPAPQSDPFVDEPYGSHEQHGFGPYEGGPYMGGMPGYGDPCCDPCSGGGCGDCCSSGGQVFFTADYLTVRSNFSHAEAFFERDANTLPVQRELHQIDFEHTSSYRLGGGYRLCGCGDEVRFMYTRFRGDSEDLDVELNDNIFIPLEPQRPVLDGVLRVGAGADVRAYDLEYAKTIPIGGRDCGCCDPCSGGCGDCCAPCCPLWDITWSGGLRYADASWFRNYSTFDNNDVFVGDATSWMDFEGVGPKVGVEGRHYMFTSGWLSAYMKGDISILIGDAEFLAQRRIEGGTILATEQYTEAKNVIPVTELEAGFTAQLTCNLRVSGGYLVSAWHDLGYRDQFISVAQAEFPLQYDTANILGFDGWFGRVELAY